MPFDRYQMCLLIASITINPTNDTNKKIPINNTRHYLLDPNTLPYSWCTRLRYNSTQLNFNPN